MGISLCATNHEAPEIWELSVAGNQGRLGGGIPSTQTEQLTLAPPPPPRSKGPYHVLTKERRSANTTIL